MKRFIGIKRCHTETGFTVKVYWAPKPSKIFPVRFIEREKPMNDRLIIAKYY
jgi:hypothetical protein